MAERPILFSSPMVRELLVGRKTQTRRMAKPVRHPDLGNVYAPGALVLEREPQHVIDRCCPYGQPGDRLWVRETFAPVYPQDPSYNGGRPIEFDYRATYVHGARLGDTLGIKKTWKPAIHMPRTASRITLEITAVRVERLQGITEADAQAEGSTPIPDACDHVRRSCSDIGCSGPQPYRVGFRSLWEDINGPDSWDANPWVWVVNFRRLDEA